MRIWVRNKVDEEEAIDFSWRSDIVLEVVFDKSKWDVDSFLLDEDNKVALCCDITLLRDEHKTRIYIVGEDMFKQVFEDNAPKASSFNWPVVISYVPSLVRIHKRTPKRHKKR
ncbi:unnamed protein product, partial [Eruca vesicaria subsp. sativa]|nr:unnamed protein product [Eruca vesicaria subsp. sativa]